MMEIQKLSRKQVEIFRFINDNNKYLICDGAVRSGKTLPISLAFLYYGMTHFNNAKFAICSKTAQVAERNILDPLFSIDLPFNIQYNRSTRVLTVTSGDKTNSFHIFGANDEKAATKIQGITLVSVFFDEIVLMPESFVKQALARMLTTPNAKVWFSCNPESPQHWFFKEYIQQRQPRTKYIHFTMCDNPLMTEEAIQNARNSFAGVFFKRFIDGIWCVAEGAIYPIFSDKKEEILTEKLPPNLQYMKIFGGLDFGGNKSRHALTFTAIDLNTKKVYVLQSRSYAAQSTTPDKLYKIVQDDLKEVQDKHNIEVDMIYADSAEQTLINGLRSRLDIRVANSLKRPINDRIRATISLMASGRLFMARNVTKDLQDAFLAAVWNDKKIEDERLDDGTYNVDILDSFEYSFERYLVPLAGIACGGRNRYDEFI